MPRNYTNLTIRFRIIAAISPKTITMGDGDIVFLFSGAFIVLSVGSAAIFWYLLR
jgi:ethanolamine utilization protein EutQ (cupin superfamily)